jgi:AbiV family abortive infection protein
MHMKLATKQYRGYLTYEQIVAGMSAAAQNAARLADDADSLIQLHRFPTAGSLALLSLEESDKVRILRSMATAIGQEDVLRVWKSYRRHTDKHSLTLLLQLSREGARRLSDFRDCVTDDGLDERQVYDSVKQLGFYTDCLGNANWSIPVEIIDEELARALVKGAKIVSERKHQGTVRELELWAIHMRTGDTRQNLLTWAKAMEADGLHPEGYEEKMTRFTEGL